LTPSVPCGVSMRQIRGLDRDKEHLRRSKGARVKSPRSDQKIRPFFDLTNTPVGGNMGELRSRSKATPVPTTIEHQARVDRQPSEGHGSKRGRER